MYNLIRYHITIGFSLARLSLKRQLEWLLTFISYLIALPIRCATGLVIIYILTTKFSPLYGWSYGQLVFLYGLAYISDGLSSTFASQARRMETLIIRGDLDRFLVRPISVLFQFLFRSIYWAGIIEVISGIIVLVYGCQQVGFVISFFNIFKIVVVIIGATFIRISFLIIVGSIAFWTKRSQTLLWVGDEIVRKTTQYPITIYPGILQALFTFILPFGFISFYPSSEFFSFNNLFNLPLNFALWTPLVGTILLVIANRVFEYGLKIYESAGA